jgi:hypothetical protein
MRNHGSSERDIVPPILWRRSKHAPYLVQGRFANVDALFFVHNFGHCQKEEYEAVERIWHADQDEADALFYVVDADASHET